VLIGAQGSPKFPKGDDMSNQSEGSTRKNSHSRRKKEKSQRKDQNTLGRGRKVLLKRPKNGTVTKGQVFCELPDRKNQNYKYFFRRGKGRFQTGACYLFLSQKVFIFFSFVFGNSF
jgi:hypothetical protein